MGCTHAQKQTFSSGADGCVSCTTAAERPLLDGEGGAVVALLLSLAAGGGVLLLSSPGAAVLLLSSPAGAADSLASAAAIAAAAPSLPGRSSGVVDGRYTYRSGVREYNNSA